MANFDQMQPNHLDWPDLYNARDLGGMPTTGGGAIKDGALIRSDRHSKLTDAGIAAVHAAGVSRIIDLRHGVECEAQPNPFSRTPLYLNIPVEDPADSDGNDGLGLAEIYQVMLDRRPELFAEAIAAVAEAPPGAVAIHCAAGKDRTGLVVALVLSVAGVYPEAIAADYGLSEQRLAEPAQRFLAGISDPAARERIAELQATSPDTMMRVLSHLDTGHGGVDTYLGSAGCTDGHLDAIRERLITTR
jgi:protein-tyrosine phosphatase